MPHLLPSFLALAILATPPDIVLVTIDTLRADHVGAYGATTGATPGLDALARLGVVVEEAVVQVPQTRPSHAGYVSATAPLAGPASAGGLPDPKDRLDHYNRYSHAVNAAIAARRRGDPAPVVHALDPVAREFSGQYSVVSYLREALLELRRFDDALPYLAWWPPRTAS